MAIKLTEKQKEIKRIVHDLTRAIAQHKLRPGTRLIESQIVEALSANRNHVQSAIQRMALQNIVTIEPNFGAIVATPSRRDGREIFIARQAIEPAVVALITPEKIVAWSAEILEQQRSERGVIDRQEAQGIACELEKFHLLLARIAGNSVLENILFNLMVRSSLVTMLYHKTETAVSYYAEHRAIVDALLKDEPERAQKMMREYIGDLQSYLDLNMPLSASANDEREDNIEINDLLRSAGGTGSTG